METVKVHKADGYIQRPVEGASILIEEDLIAPISYEYSRLVYRADAAAIWQALSDNLPGGTLDQLLILMLENKASVLKVPYGK